MQTTKYLHLKKKGLPWVGAHYSCLLDEYFREKNTVDGKNRKHVRQKAAKLIHKMFNAQSYKSEVDKVKSGIGTKFASLMDKVSFLKKTKRYNKENRDLSSFSNLDKAHNHRQDYTSMVESSEVDPSQKDEAEGDSETNKKSYSQDEAEGESESGDQYDNSEEDDEASNDDLQSSLFADQSLNEKNIDKSFNRKYNQGNNESRPKLLSLVKTFTEKTKDAQGELNEHHEHIEGIKRKEKEEQQIETLKQERRVLDQKEAKEYRLPRVNIEAIEFGWILNDNEGTNFLKELSKSEGTDLFDLRIIRLILLFLWEHYSKRLNLLLLLPSFVYLVLFVAYSTWIHNEKIGEDRKGGAYDVTNIVMVILLLAFTVYFIVIECFHF